MQIGRRRADRARARLARLRPGARTRDGRRRNRRAKCIPGQPGAKAAADAAAAETAAIVARVPPATEAPTGTGRKQGRVPDPPQLSLRRNNGPSERRRRSAASEASRWWESNPRPDDYKSPALPLRHTGLHAVSRRERRLSVQTGSVNREMAVIRRAFGYRSPDPRQSNELRARRSAGRPDSRTAVTTPRSVDHTQGDQLPHEDSRARRRRLPRLADRASSVGARSRRRHRRQLRPSQLRLRDGRRQPGADPQFQRRIATWKEVSGHTVQPFIGDLTDHHFVEHDVREFAPDAVVHFAEQRSAPVLDDRPPATPSTPR